MSFYTHFSRVRFDEYNETHCIGNEVEVVKSSFYSGSVGKGKIVAVSFTPMLTGSNIYHIELESGETVKALHFDIKGWILR